MEALRQSAPGATLLENPVEEVNDRTAFVRLREDWDTLVQETRNEVFLRHGFIRTWIDNFAPEARLRILLLRDAAGHLSAILPLFEEKTRIYGVPVRELCATANTHSCRFDLIARHPQSAAQAFFEYLARDESWDVVRLTDVPEGGNGYELLRAAESAGFPTGAWESLRSPYIPVPAGLAELQKQLPSKFKANVRRRRRKLEEKGSVVLERYSGGIALEERLQEGFELEQSGWKGARGTAMAQDSGTRGFYRELARVAEDSGWLSLYFLRLGGRAVAFHYGLTYGGRYLLLKPGYDEGLGECSPGQLLVEDVLKHGAGREFSEFDFLGPDMTWKRDWTDSVRPHAWLYIFRNTSLGRTLKRAKFQWAPTAKKVMQWVR